MKEDTFNQFIDTFDQLIILVALAMFFIMLSIPFWYTKGEGNHFWLTNEDEILEYQKVDIGSRIYFYTTDFPVCNSEKVGKIYYSDPDIEAIWECKGDKWKLISDLYVSTIPPGEYIMRIK